MRLSVESLDTLDAAIAAGEYSDYLYMYPPRQAYRRLGDVSRASGMVQAALHSQADLNLYIHVPFCAQICRFCNLYTTSVHDADIYTQYVDRVCAEARAYASSGLLPRSSRWRTLYFGGGTPSALPIELLEKLLVDVRDNLAVADVEELAIEVSPETVTPQYLRGLRAIGFDRVSMGFQTTSPAEMRLIGRSYQVAKQADIAKLTMDLGFRNLCLDLIFGLPGQDRRSWSESLRSVIAMQPHTICCYQWTSRPNTGFGKMGLQALQGPEMRELYNVACGELREAGYAQETHVRWVRDGGGYLQKKYHWGLQNLLGLGAGARSYFWDIDLRNGYSLKNRKNALESYLKSEGVGWRTPLEGYEMSDDERRRKAVVLGLHALDRGWFARLFGSDVAAFFPAEIEGLRQRGLIDVSADQISLSEKGMAHRDLVIQLFFSEKARGLAREWDYDE
jgi:oxygen-independent coproporphyrinogen III oxidase